MRLVFYPPQDNLDLWSMRSSGRQFCHSSCSWRHSRPRAPLESSSRRWILPRPGTPARCSRAQSCLSPTDRECGQTSPTTNISRNHPFVLEGFYTHRVAEDTTWPSRVSTLCGDDQDCDEGEGEGEGEVEGECLDVPDVRHLEPHSALDCCQLCLLSVSTVILQLIWLSFCLIVLWEKFRPHLNILFPWFSVKSKVFMNQLEFLRWHALQHSPKSDYS